MSGNRVIIVGASTRSAAASCLRAGLQPICLDLFGDRDLKEFAEVHVLSDLSEVVEQMERLTRDIGPSLPVMYTGGMENRSEAIEEISLRYKLWGCGPKAVKDVRDPFQLACTLRDAQCRALKVQREPPVETGDWLVKPVHGGGGLGIRRWNSSRDFERPQESMYFQEYREGRSMSAIFVANAARDRGCELLGVCRQLIGEKDLHATEFAWCGAIGNVMVSSDTFDQLRRIGDAAGRKFELAGLFGVDFILDEGGVPWVTEINPRYTGSVEVLEWSLGKSLLARHIQSFVPDWKQPGDVAAADGNRQNVVGKAILYAPRNLIAMTGDWEVARPDHPPPCVVDVSAHGQQIANGAPICSLLVRAETEADCATQLREFCRQIYGRIAEWPENIGESGL